MGLKRLIGISVSDKKRGIGENSWHGDIIVASLVGNEILKAMRVLGRSISWSIAGFAMSTVDFERVVLVSTWGASASFSVRNFLADLTER